MIKPVLIGLIFTMMALPVIANESDYGEVTYVCRGDAVATTSGYRTAFREKNRLKRLVFLLRSEGIVTVREGDSPEVPFAPFVYYEFEGRPVVSTSHHKNTLRLNLDNMKFVATSPGSHIAGDKGENPWLIAGKCLPV